MSSFKKGNTCRKKLFVERRNKMCEGKMATRADSLFLTSLMKTAVLWFVLDEANDWHGPIPQPSPKHCI